MAAVQTGVLAPDPDHQQQQQFYYFRCGLKRRGVAVTDSDSNRMVGFGTVGIKPSTSTAKHLFLC
jgi:hypothetical protein